MANYNDLLKEIDLSKDTNDVLVDLSRLSNKYSHYQNQRHNKNKNNNSDEIMGILDGKDIVINNMASEIKQLKQQIIDLSVTYNKKIEDLKIKHKKDLMCIHSDYVRRMNQNNTTITE